MSNEVDFFYHATGDDEESLNKMLNIIKTGSIKSLRKQNLTGGLFNGDDYISVAAWEPDMNIDSPDLFFSSSFGGFIFGLPCFILSSDIPAIKCEVWKRGAYDSKRKRVSQYVDEWHVKDEIPLDKVVGIALPKEEFLSSEEMELVKQILNFAQICNWEVFVSDTNLVNAVRERFKQKNK